MPNGSPNKQQPSRTLLRFAGVAATLLVWLVWLAHVGPANAWSTVFNEWPVALTMVFGSFIAGASSEGGGAVAFPVFTKVLHVPPSQARLFALAIQSVGMTAAAVSIIAMRVRVDWRAIGWATIGGAVATPLSLLVIAPLAPPAEVKMLFTAMQAGFAVVLLMSMRAKHRRTIGARMPSKAAPGSLIAAGFTGGLLTGLVGSGIDLVVFSMLVLLFRISEKVATPTSVVLMAGHSLIAMLAYGLAHGPLPTEVVSMWLAAVPVVVVGAPIGAAVCSRLSRQTIAWSLVALICVEVISSLWLIRQTASTLAVSLGALGCFSGLFLVMLRCERFDPSALRTQRVAEGAPTSLRTPRELEAIDRA